MSDRCGSSARIRILALAVCLVLSAFRPGFSIAQERPPAGTPSEPARVESPAQDNAASPEGQSAVESPAQDNAATPPPESAAAEMPSQDNAAKPGFLDKTHERLQRGILGRVVWFDQFFGKVGTEELRQPDYQLRWRNSVRMEEGGRFKYRTSAHGRFVLPGISERLRLRLRLFIAGETEAEPVDATLPQEPGVPGFDRTLSNTRVVSTELRYVVIQKPAVELFLGTGVRVRIPFEWFVRTRFLYSYRLGEKTLARFGETLFWKSTDGLGETTELALDRQLGSKTILRWANSGTWHQESRGLEWGSDLSLLKELSARSGMLVSGGVFGITDPTTRVETYRILTRYRRNFWRPWLYYELEPEISWPRDETGSYTSAYAFTLRLEIVFQGSAEMAEKKPIPKI